MTTASARARPPEPASSIVGSRRRCHAPAVGAPARTSRNGAPSVRAGARDAGTVADALLTARTAVVTVRQGVDARPGAGGKSGVALDAALLHDARRDAVLGHLARRRAGAAV